MPPPGGPSESGRRHRTISGPRDVTHEGERERQERFEELERHLNDAADGVNSAEDRREHAFRENEDARERMFAEAEERRAAEANERREQIWRDLEEKVGSLHPTSPVAAPGSSHLDLEGEEAPAAAREDDATSMIGSMRDAAALHAEQIMETVRLEREQMDREREEAAQERERLFAEGREDRARLEEEREERIRALETELANVKEELENEKGLRLSEETERRERERMENMERDEAVRNQLSDITNLVQEQRDECARKKDVNDERWEDKLNRRGQKDNQLAGLYEMINRIMDDREAERVRQDEERLAAEAKPGASYCS